MRFRFFHDYAETKPIAFKQIYYGARIKNLIDAHIRLRKLLSNQDAVKFMAEARTKKP